MNAPTLLDRRGRALSVGDEISVHVPLNRYAGSPDPRFSRHVGLVVGFRVDGVGHELVDYRDDRNGSLRAAISPWIVRRRTARFAERARGRR